MSFGWRDPVKRKNKVYDKKYSEKRTPSPDTPSKRVLLHFSINETIILLLRHSKLFAQLDMSRY